MEIKSDCIELSWKEFLLCFKRRIEFKGIEREEIVEREKVRLPAIRWPGTHIPGIITIGTYYDVPKKDVLKIFAALIVYALSFLVILYYCYPLRCIVCFAYLLLFPALLYLMWRIVRKYPKEFWIVAGRCEKVKVIYPRNSEYRRIVVGIRE